MTPLALTDFDLHLFAEGTHHRTFDKFGAHVTHRDGVAGTYFAVWAPNAASVAVFGDFNGWDRTAHPLQPIGNSGVWERFVPGIGTGVLYKYHIHSLYNNFRVDKADPYAFAAERPPGTASKVFDLNGYEWGDGDWMAARAQVNRIDVPISIYEVHLGSWMRLAEQNNRWLSYRELAPKLANHALEMGFTHVEFLPIAEYPFDGSWGYQTTGYYAATSRFGTPHDLMYLIDTLHRRGLGVILDWVPAHFPRDEHGLAYFDGTHLYEYSDPRLGEHRDWDTYVFDYGRRQVKNYLISNALFWLDQYHVDGLRVDAVSSMLYLDYSRQPGEWVPNRFGGRENLEAVSFVQQVNDQVHNEHPDVLMIAEESTSWPKVTRATTDDGLGFDLKWDLGWMHDTLNEYLRRDPIERKHHHDKITFRPVYAFNENYILPLSHDEVVHGKGSLLNKMPGAEWYKFAQLRLLLGFQFAEPGKKLVFMGTELGSYREWDHDRALDWHLLDQPLNAGLKRWVRDLNTFYRGDPAAYQLDTDPAGFRWVNGDDAEQSTLAFLRLGRNPNQKLLFVYNFTPVLRRNHRVGVPVGGHWAEQLNSDATLYGGAGQGNLGGVLAAPISAQGFPQALNLTLPPLSMLVFSPAS